MYGDYNPLKTWSFPTLCNPTLMNISWLTQQIKRLQESRVTTSLRHEEKTDCQEQFYQTFKQWPQSHRIAFSTSFTWSKEWGSHPELHSVYEYFNVQTLPKLYDLILISSYLISTFPIAALCFQLVSLLVSFSTTFFLSHTLFLHHNCSRADISWGMIFIKFSITDTTVWYLHCLKYLKMPSQCKFVLMLALHAPSISVMAHSNEV